MRSQVIVAATLFVSAQAILRAIGGTRRRSHLGGRKSLPLLQAESSFEVQQKAFDAVRGPADQPLPSEYHVAAGTASQRSRLQEQRDSRHLPGDGRQALSAEPARLGVADARFHLLRPQRAAAALYDAPATANIPGARRRKITSFPRLTPSTSTSPPISWRPPARAIACGHWQARRPGAAAETRTQPCGAKLVIKRVPSRLIARFRAFPSECNCRTARSSPIPTSSSRICLSSRSATASLRGKAIRTGR